MESLLAIIILVGVVCFAFWAIRALVTAFGVENPWATVIYVVAFTLVLLVVLRYFGVADLPRIRS